jgi:hypothetical protein
VRRTSDAELVAAIEQAYRDGYQRFLTLALGMLGDVDRARDAVQEAFATPCYPDATCGTLNGSTPGYGASW